MRVLTEQGTTVVVHDLGGDGPAVLICHATGLCGRAYEPLARVLAKERHVWAVDLRGHGDSPPPADGDFAWEGILEDVLAAVRAIGVARPHVLGHSMGGAIALQAEANHPGLFASAYLYEPVVVPPAMLARPDNPYGQPSNPMAYGARNRREVFPSKPAALWRYAARPPLQDLSAGSLAAYVEHGFEELPDGGGARLRCRAEYEARTFEASGTITWATVAPVAIPVVIATGAESESDLLPFAPGLADSLPRGRHISYRHLSHFGPLQDVHTVGRDVLAHTAAHA